MERDFGVLPLADNTPILTVSQLNELVKGTLETALDPCWVVGEVSNFRVPPSGHCYFTLKDENSQMACVMFRSYVRGLGFQPENGMEVLCYGRVSLYAARGDLQLYVETMEPKGLGALYLAYEQLKNRLFDEGLFDQEKKKPLPLLPRSIGIVTSPRGAALRDMLRILEDRFPDRRVVIRPVKVQGEGAAREIAQGIRELVESRLVDVLIVGRGGGSLEDLWAFNEEEVARSIFASPLPVISAVGHEVDFTIADFVADHRAPTPTAAAEMVVPRRTDLQEEVESFDGRLIRAFQGALSLQRDRWQGLARRLVDPTRRLRENQMKLDDLTLSLWRRCQGSLDHFKERLAPLAGRLGSLSPLSVLERGYSIVYKMPEGRIVKDSSSVEVGDLLRVHFSRGNSMARVEKKE